MTETDKPKLFEHDRKMTTMNVNWLNLTERKKQKLKIPQRPKYMIEVDQIFCRCGNFSVKFKKSIFVVVSFW